MLRILHVIPAMTEEQGGTSACVTGLARYEAEVGHEVTVLTTNQGERRGETPIDLNGVVDVQRMRVLGPDRRAYAPEFRKAVRRLISKSDLVHVHSVFNYPVHAALGEAREAGAATVLSTHGMLHRYSLRRSRWKKRLYLARWGRMIRHASTCWHYTSQNESQESWPWDAGPRFLLPPFGIEPSEFSLDRGEARKGVRDAWPQIGDSPYVLFLGRLHPKKRPDLLVEAFLSGAPREYKLVVAGPDECGLWDAICERLLQDGVARERVVRLGMVTGPSKLDLLAGATLFALSSEHENFGITPLEALATGTPVLLSPHVDMVQGAVAANVGFVAPVELPAWSDRLAELLAQPEALASLSVPARQWAAGDYAWREIARSFIDRYRWVLAGCPDSQVQKTTPTSPPSANDS